MPVYREIKRVRYCPNPNGNGVLAQELRNKIESLPVGSIFTLRRYPNFQFVARGSNAYIVSPNGEMPEIFNGILELATVEVVSSVRNLTLTVGSWFANNGAGFCQVKQGGGEYHILAIAKSLRQALEITNNVIDKRIVMDGNPPNNTW